VLLLLLLLLKLLQKLLLLLLLLLILSLHLLVGPGGLLGRSIASLSFLQPLARVVRPQIHLPILSAIFSLLLLLPIEHGVGAICLVAARHRASACIACIDGREKRI